MIEFIYLLNWRVGSREPTSESASTFRARIPRMHPGSQQIGGTEAEGQRILLDLGLPLDAEEPTPALLPDIHVLIMSNPSLRAPIISPVPTGIPKWWWRPNFSQKY
jgi:hypothetical protein